MDFDKRKKKADAIISMEDRAALETSVGAKLNAALGYYEKQLEDINVILNAARVSIDAQTKESGEVDPGILRIYEQQQQRYRQTLKDYTGELEKIRKQYKLFSSLDRPQEDDPIYTPVHLFVLTEPPPQALVDNLYELEPDDANQPAHVNPGVQAGNMAGLEAQ